MRKRILIADDEGSVLAAAARQLRLLEGFEVKTFKTPSEIVAIAHDKTFLPDLIILDIYFDNDTKTGEDTYKVLRESSYPYLKRVPILMLSGKIPLSEAAAKENSEEGIFYLLKDSTKPLVEKVKEILGM